MLKSVDVLLGLTVVMLTISMVVTVLTATVANLLQMRGRHLLEGITGLLKQMGCQWTESQFETVTKRDCCKEIAEAILTHPLIKSAGSRFGTVIHREELTALLLELAANDGPSRLSNEARAALSALLARNGIAAPEAVMKNVRTLALMLEQVHPELSNNERHAIAFLQEANSEFLAKINGWFDQTIDRVADRFTNSTRIVTFACGLIVALFLQLDTVALLNRLWMDPAARASLVQQAVQMDKQSQGGTITDTDRKKLVSDFTTMDLIKVPESFNDWSERWKQSWVLKLVGILVSALLLNLGAPFWYNSLKNLLRLRSLIAQKDDDQRTARQTNQTPVASTEAGVAAGKAAAFVAGERGDLNLVG
jgi:hypothetical protein